MNDPYGGAVGPGRNPTGDPMQAGGGGGGGGYGGLQGIFDLISTLGQAGGATMNQNQYNDLYAGHAGGKFGGLHGFGKTAGGNMFDGLSKYGAHWLAQNYLQKIAPTLADTTGLTGDALFNANMSNMFANAAPARYQGNLHGQDMSMVQKFLDSLGDLGGKYHGHSAYRKHHNASH